MSDNESMVYFRMVNTFSRFTLLLTKKETKWDYTSVRLLLWIITSIPSPWCLVDGFFKVWSLWRTCHYCGFFFLMMDLLALCVGYCLNIFKTKPLQHSVSMCLYIVLYVHMLSNKHKSFKNRCFTLRSCYLHALLAHRLTQLIMFYMLHCTIIHLGGFTAGYVCYDISFANFSIMGYFVKIHIL